MNKGINFSKMAASLPRAEGMLNLTPAGAEERLSRGALPGLPRQGDEAALALRRPRGPLGERR
jgi:hypothetical protein